MNRHYLTPQCPLNKHRKPLLSRAIKLERHFSHRSEHPALMVAANLNPANS